MGKSYWYVTFSTPKGFVASTLEIPGRSFKPIDAIEFVSNQGIFKFTEIGIYYHKRISKAEYIRFRELSKKK